MAYPELDLLHGCPQCQAHGSELALTPGVLPSTSPHEVSTAQPSRSREALSTVPPPGAGMQTSCDRGTAQQGRGVDIKGYCEMDSTLASSQDYPMG